MAPDPREWQVEQLTGSPEALHARAWPDPVVRTVWVHHPDRVAVALGSAQRPDLVDADAAAAAGVEVVRRRSGGGAVLLVPGGSTWVDVVIPTTDARWDPDVGRAFHWLGEAWAEALGQASEGTVAVHVHRGPMLRSRWSDLVCFAGLGAGEVTVGDLGPKLVGLSQRRTRAGARFQCIVHHRWDPAALLAVLELPEADRARGAGELAGAAATWTGDPHLLVAAFLAALAAR